MVFLASHVITRWWYDLHIGVGTSPRLALLTQNIHADLKIFLMEVAFINMEVAFIHMEVAFIHMEVAFIHMEVAFVNMEVALY